MADATRPISVCAFVPYAPDTTPSQRFRLEQWIPYLRDEGIAVDLVPFADERLMRVLHQPGHWAEKTTGLARAVLLRMAEVASARRYDVVFIHRALSIVGPGLLERVLPWFGKPIVFDFDDAIWLLDTTEANRHFGWLKFPGKTSAICRLSTHIVVGNGFLAEYAGRFNRRVTVIPTSVDTERFRPVPKTMSGGPIVIGWTGSSTSQSHLEMFAPDFREIFARPDVELRVHSNRRPELGAIPHVWIPWRPESEPADIAPFDIGIMPIPDDRWARGKCALKALLYMAMGIPAVLSEVGTNREVIDHGVNGFLANTKEEWCACLERLIEDRAMRAQLGGAGRRTVEERYSMTHCATQFADVVRAAVQGSPDRLVREATA
jgi:glycosyltransferase involved in cell wall biosynthesis